MRSSIQARQRAFASRTVATGLSHVTLLQTSPKRLKTMPSIGVAFDSG